MVIRELPDIQKLLEGSVRVAIVTKADPGYDDIATALALAQWLVARNVQVDVACQALNAHRFKFLPGFDRLREQLQIADQFVIRVNVSKTKVQELSYDLIGDALEIRIKPKDGNFVPQDVSFAQSEFTYQSIIVVGAHEMHAVGSVFETHRELFYNVPIINIDRRVSNTRFGQVNVVYPTVTSLAEIVYGIIGVSLTADIATCLYAGLTAATNSFQTPQVTPDTLRLASDLIVAGAKRDEVVERLYRTKDVDKLKVWGRVLAHLSLVDSRIVMSRITRADTDGREVDLEGLVDDLVLASPQADVILFFSEQSSTDTTVYAYARENFDLHTMFASFTPHGDQSRIAFTVAAGLTIAEERVVSIAREKLKLIAR